jgi:organic hydroperoxide reductase OsmC/OhrA
MANKHHTYSIRVDWTGNQGTGTSAYRAYSRAHEISAPGKTAIAGSSDPVFRGDAARWNPAELLIAALSACHQLWYLHLCADAGIVVVAYSDDASGVEIDQSDGAGHSGQPCAIADGRAFYAVVRAFAALALPQSDPGFIRSG